MAMIKNALSAVPSRPALVIAPLLVVLVLSLYYRDQYNKCVEIRQTRLEFNQQLHALASPAQFPLRDFTDFAWTKVRIVASVAADTISDTCPLDWNWESGERDALIASGRLAAMMFGQQGRIVRYVELRADEVEFRGAEGNLSPQAAVFNVERKSGAADGFILTLNN
ncbi:MAG: hypothetical protein GY815_15545 [Gammaproteobacteria bacterium]|nr:hypothetical protein [Gammaproteobacteria bacterium]